MSITVESLSEALAGNGLWLKVCSLYHFQIWGRKNPANLWRTGSGGFSLQLPNGMKASPVATVEEVLTAVLTIPECDADTPAPPPEANGSRLWRRLNELLRQEAGTQIPENSPCEQPYAELVATNQRLHRRCQEAESELVKVQRAVTAERVTWKYDVRKMLAAHAAEVRAMLADESCCTQPKPAGLFQRLRSVFGL
jgi:hypothetical protein